MRVPLEALIEKRHDDRSQWAVIRELRAGVGFSHRGVDRAIDVAAFNCWPSKGLHRIAYEVKRSRGDFMREIDQPKKREWVEKNFHMTYFVVSHGVCQPEEVPESWGLYVATKKGDKLRRVKVAQHREIDPLPELVALSAIRALATKNHLMASRHYFFEGMWIRQEQLDELVKEGIEEELAPAQVAMQRTIESSSREAEEYRQKRLALQAPLVELAKSVGEHLRFSSYRKQPDVTVEEVRAWVKRARSQAVKPLLNQLQHASDSIQTLLDEAHRKDLEGGREKPKG